MVTDTTGACEPEAVWIYIGMTSVRLVGHPINNESKSMWCVAAWRWCRSGCAIEQLRNFRISFVLLVSKLVCTSTMKTVFFSFSTYCAMMPASVRRTKRTQVGIIAETNKICFPRQQYFYRWCADNLCHSHLVPGEWVVTWFRWKRNRFTAEVLQVTESHPPSIEFRARVISDINDLGEGISSFAKPYHCVGSSSSALCIRKNAN